MKRLGNIIGGILIAAVLTIGIASAATLEIGTGQLSAGNASIHGCTSSPLTATRNVDNSGNVTQVNVTNVPQTCANETLAVTLESSSHGNLGSASATVGTCSGGCAVAVTGFGTVPASNVTAYAFSLTQ